MEGSKKHFGIRVGLEPWSQGRAYYIIMSCIDLVKILTNLRTYLPKQAGRLTEDVEEVKATGGFDKVKLLPADFGVEKHAKGKENSQEGEPVELEEARRLASI